MPAYTKGRILYTRDGRKVLFEFEYEGTAYVREVFEHMAETRIADYEDYEWECWLDGEELELVAAHLVSTPMRNLSPEPPRKVVAADYDTLARMLDGESLYPLSEPYDRDRAPTIPRLESTNIVILKPKNINDTIRFFTTKDARAERVRELFSAALKSFRERGTYGGSRRYGYTYANLESWVEQFEYLEIPEDIVAAKKAYDNARKEEQLAQLREQIAELTKESDDD